MSFGVLGILWTLLGIVLIIFTNLKLYHVLFLSAPLFDVIVFYVSGTQVNSFVIFGSLSILSYYPRMVKAVKIDKLTVVLLVFLLVVLISIFMPIIYKGEIMVLPFSAEFADYKLTIPLSFTYHNVKQVFYPVFMVLVFIAVKSKIKNFEDLILCVRLFMLSAIIVILSGLFFLIGYFVIGVSVYDVQAYLQHGIWDSGAIVARVLNYNNLFGIPRIYSFAGEPSFHANFLVVMFSLSFAYLILNKSKGRKIKFCAAWTLFVLFNVVLTGSTTGYLGIVVTVFIAPLILLYLGELKKHTVRRYFIFVFLLFFVIFFMAILLFVISNNSLFNYLYESHANKIISLSGSGLIRYEVNKVAIDAFLQLPLLGVGYGSNRTTSLFFSLLSNVGLIGMLTFLMFNYMVVSYKLSLDNRLRCYSTSYAIAIIVWLIMSFIATPVVALIFPWYWMLVVLLLASRNIGSQQPKNMSRFF